MFSKLLILANINKNQSKGDTDINKVMKGDFAKPKETPSMSMGGDSDTRKAFASRGFAKTRSSLKIDNVLRDLGIEDSSDEDDDGEEGKILVMDII